VGPAGAGGPRDSEASRHERGGAEPGARRGKREEEDDGLTGGPKLSARGRRGRARRRASERAKVGCRVGLPCQREAGSARR